VVFVCILIFVLKVLRLVKLGLVLLSLTSLLLVPVHQQTRSLHLLFL